MNNLKIFASDTSLDKSVKTFNELAGITQNLMPSTCVKVLTADGKEDNKETQMIEKIVADLGLNHKEYLIRKEKILLKSDTISGVVLRQV